MTDLAASDLTYSFNIKDKVFLGRKGYQVRGTITFGNGALTVPSAGVPITKGKMGLPRFVRSLQVIESNVSGYRFEYDVSAESLKLQRIGAPTGNVAAPTISFVSNSGNVAADKVIGVNALSNGASLVANTVLVNVIGVQAPAFTGDAATLANFTGAPASMVLEVEAEGY